MARLVERGSAGRWLFFLVVTLGLALPLGVAYWFEGARLEKTQERIERVRIANQLNLWQEQLNDITWDGRADTFDDTLHLGSYDPDRLLVETLRWYVYPDGHCFIEGMGVLDAQGRLTSHRQAAVIDDAGEPLSPLVLQRLRKRRPWLESPWLNDYRFVAKAFLSDPEAEHYISPFLKAPGRLVFVIASPWRDSQGKFRGAVFMQLSVAEIYDTIIMPGAKQLAVWLMDSRGTIGVATNPLARQGARTFARQGYLKRVLRQGRLAADKGKYGTSGSLWLQVDGRRCLVSYRSAEDHFILGVVQPPEILRGGGPGVLETYGLISLVSLFILACAGAVYTLAALKQQARSVERKALQRYAATISHRVGNDLAVISGCLELIAEGRVKDPERVRKLIADKAMGAVEDIAGTVEELKLFAQGEVDLDYEGQLERDTMFNLGTKKNQGGGNESGAGGR